MVPFIARVGCTGATRAMATAGVLMLLACAGSAAAQDQGAGAGPRATYAMTEERFLEAPKSDWKGFITGLEGFDHFYEPVGQPIYFESPFNKTGVRFLYLRHWFADDSQLQGGSLQVAAVQARLAVSERWSIIATKDGYSWLDADAFPEDNGWNAIAAGAKYAAIVDRENDFVLSVGARAMLNSGESAVLQHSDWELSPFVTAAKGWDKFHLIGDLTVRVPTDGDAGNDVVQWDLHADYELMDGFAPVVEIHGLHYVGDGDAAPFSVGGLDYTNLGSSDVSGSTVIWAGIGARWKFNPNTSLGATFEFALTNRNADIMDKRVTLDFQITF